MHQRQIDHAGFINQHHTDLERSERVPPVGAATFRRLRSPFQSSVECDRGNPLQEGAVALVEPRQSGGRLCDRLSDAAGSSAGRCGNENLVGSQGRINAVSDGQERGRCGGFTRARPSGEDTHRRIHEGSDGQALLGVVEVGLDRAGARSADSLRW